MSEKLFTTPLATGAPESVDKERGVIYGAKIIQVGEAKGHGLFVDGEFIDRVQELGNGLKQGIKARFGHPNMCSTTLGTFLGRWKGLFRDGDAIRGNLYLSNTAKETPHGDLFNYVLNMADQEPDMFGVSIDFSRDLDAEQEAGVDEESGLQLARIHKLHCADAVDSPAATDGMFSRFSGETVAGQVTRFLDEHPDVWDALSGAPEVLSALARHGSRIDEFTTRYREYREQNKETEMSTDETAVAETTEEVVEELGATETPDEAASETAETEALEESVEEVASETEAAESVEEELKAEEPEQLSRDEFTRIADEFGSDIAVQTVKDGGDYNTALAAYAAGLKADNESLREEIAQLKSSASGRPAKVTGSKRESKSLFKTSK